MRGHRLLQLEGWIANIEFHSGNKKASAVAEAVYGLDHQVAITAVSLFELRRHH